MATPLDPPAIQALDALEAGDTAKLAQLFEDGEDLELLLKFLTPAHRNMIANSLRRGAARGRGPRPKDNLARDRDIAIAVAFWMGYGSFIWSGPDKPSSVFHRAKHDLEQCGYHLTPGSVRNIFNQYKPDIVARLYMPEAFLDGAKIGIAEAEHKPAFLREAIKRHGSLKLADTPSWTQFLQLHANSSK